MAEYAGTMKRQNGKDRFFRPAMSVHSFWIAHPEVYDFCNIYEEYNEKARIRQYKFMPFTAAKDGGKSKNVHALLKNVKK